jgi:DNA mismatch repair protein MutL
MPRIHQLSPTLVNQIAAGEVVERPASVVKELLENSLDAGARRIEVEVGKGGVDLIQVVDDGCGIEAEDLPLAFSSHATSKLSCSEDLFRIGTLGFRGEALASVGSIAQVRLQSRPAGQAHGAEIICHSGQLGPVAPWNGSPGTRIEVRHLFYNVPARRKFLKGAGTEMGHVSEVFTRLALAHLGVHWSLKHNGRLVHETPASMGLLERIGLFFGTEVENSLHMVEGEEEGITLGGYVGDPSCDQGGTQLQYLFLNGRWVRDRGLFQAVQNALVANQPQAAYDQTSTGFRKRMTLQKFEDLVKSHPALTGHSPREALGLDGNRNDPYPTVATVKETVLAPDNSALPPLGASVVGLEGSPSGQGPLLATSALFPGRATGPASYTLVLVRESGEPTNPNSWRVDDLIFP